jgi:hypothetical protein
MDVFPVQTKALKWITFLTKDTYKKYNRLKKEGRRESKEGKHKKVRSQYGRKKRLIRRYLVFKTRRVQTSTLLKICTTTKSLKIGLPPYFVNPCNFVRGYFNDIAQGQKP